MPLPDQVRLRISDPWRFGEEVRYGDGLASQFKLAQGAPFSQVSALSAYLPAAGGWSAVTASAVSMGLGTLTLTGTLQANSAVRFVYQWAVFSEAEVGEFITAGGGTVPGAALQAVRSLQFASLRRAKWAAPDGTEYDDTAAMRQLLAMEEKLVEEIEKDEGPAGGIESWGEQQGNYFSEYNA